MELLVVAAVSARAAESIGIAPECVEPLQIVRYGEGQKYDLHHDTGTVRPGFKSIDVVPPRRIANLAESESVKKSVLTSQKSWSIATTSCLITRPFFAAFGIAEISASVVDKHVCFVDADALTTKIYVPRIPNITITRHCVGGSPKSASVKMNRYKQLRIMSCRL